MKVLAVDVGGTHVKILATGQTVRREFPSGPRMTPAAMVSGVKALAEGWAYDVVAMGYPGPVLHQRPVAEPHNLAAGWVGFDYAAAFERPVRGPVLVGRERHFGMGLFRPCADLDRGAA